MRSTLLILAITSGLCAGPVYAQNGAGFAKAHGCMNCHALEQKKVAVSFKDIASKYAGNPNAASVLTTRLKYGKRHPRVAAPSRELKAMVEYILSVK